MLVVDHAGSLYVPDDIDTVADPDPQVHTATLYGCREERGDVYGHGVSVKF